MNQTKERLGLDHVITAAADASDFDSVTALLGEAGHPRVDMVVLDAPCSGLGTLRRHPELRYRALNKQRGLWALQAKLLDNLSQFLGTGGSLVYAVCTITPEEGTQQIQSFLERHPEFSPVEITDPELKPYATDLGPDLPNTCLKTWTHRDHCDSFFAVKLQKMRES